MGHSATVECEGAPYERALCWYAAEELDRAEQELERIVMEGVREPEMPRAVYFLARIKMRKGEWGEASELLVRLHGLSPSFYREWSGDYLLGVCRAKEGLDRRWRE